jgi:hypothetical protein
MDALEVDCTECPAKAGEHCYYYRPAPARSIGSADIPWMYPNGASHRERIGYAKGLTKFLWEMKTMTLDELLPLLAEAKEPEKPKSFLAS